MHKKLFTVLLAFSCAFGQTCWAQQDLKIGYIDATRIYEQSEPAKAALRRIDEEMAPRKKKLQEDNEQFLLASKRFESDSKSMQATERLRAEQALQGQLRELNQRKNELDDERVARTREAAIEINDLANKISRKIGHDEKFDLIVLDGAFMSTRIDITDKVIRALDKH